ncbi:MAG: sigma 54-interacting transcriptional regulator, partial [Mailhella sp.]|nr:sigma 54-interacting transcriptional regulator [Mailhella sp.]
TQVRFLRVLEDGMVRHIGGAKEIAVDVRIVAATHNNLSDRVLSGSFRKDLWYRLSVLVLEVPPLRRRLDDLPYLVRHFVERKAALMGLKRIPAVPAEEMMKLLHYPWPGHVRDLEHVVERALIKELLTNRGKLVFEYIPLKESGEHAEPAAVPPDGSDAEETGRDWPTLREFENRYIRDVMRHCGGKLTGSGSATSILDIHYTTLMARLREMGLEGAS